MKAYTENLLCSIVNYKLNVLTTEYDKVTALDFFSENLA